MCDGSSEPVNDCAMVYIYTYIHTWSGLTYPHTFIDSYNITHLCAQYNLILYCNRNSGSSRHHHHHCILIVFYIYIYIVVVIVAECCVLSLLPSSVLYYTSRWRLDLCMCSCVYVCMVPRYNAMCVWLTDECPCARFYCKASHSVWLSLSLSLSLVVQPFAAVSVARCHSTCAHIYTFKIYTQSHGVCMHTHTHTHANNPASHPAYTNHS